MSLCDLNCCDLKWLQTKFDAINKKISDNQKLQDKINTNIFKLLKESGIDVETLLKNYYALNEEDYSKTLTSEDDINTLEPGTYKIVKTDMPQNAPTGNASSEYDGTLIQSNSYALLFENGFLHIGNFLTGINKFTWNYVINSNLLNIHLQSYMLISKYSDGEFINDIHTLNERSTGVYIVNSATQNLPVQQNGIIIVRLGTATNSLFVTFIPEDSFDVYYCAKKADGTWTEWGQVAFMSNVPSLAGYATQEWVNQQIQDITGGSVTEDWVKNNYYALTLNQYKPIPENANYTTLSAGCYYGNATNFSDEIISSLGGSILLIKFNVYQPLYYRAIIYDIRTNRIHFLDMNTNQMKQIAYSEDIPSLSGYATQAWVQSQNYLTEIPDDYATDTEVSQAIATALVGYATQSWVNGRGYQTATQVSAAITAAITGYATEQYVNKNYLAIESTLYSDIPENADLNDYKTVGNYFCSTAVKAKTLKNTPKGLSHAFKLTYEEIASNSHAVQKIIENTTGNEYIRVKVNNNWGKWEKVAFITDIPSLSGYATQTWTKSNFYSLNKDLYSTINSNDDLNDYTTKGCYYSVDYNTTKTLSNVPNDIHWGFKLTIEEISYNNYLTQKISENVTGNIYVRILEGTKGWHDWERIAYISDLPNLSNYATQEWVQQQGYQTVQQVNSLIKNATADMLTQEDLDTFNYATENWVLQTALSGYAKESWVNTKLNDYLPKTQEMSLTTQGTFYGLQYQWARYGQVVEVFLVGNLTQKISNQLISNFCPANPMRTLQTVIPGYDDTKHYAEFNNDGLKLMGSYQNELYINCHFTYLTNE